MVGLPPVVDPQAAYLPLARLLRAKPRFEEGAALGIRTHLLQVDQVEAASLTHDLPQRAQGVDMSLIKETIAVVAVELCRPLQKA